MHCLYSKPAGTSMATPHVVRNDTCACMCAQYTTCTCVCVLSILHVHVCVCSVYYMYMCMYAQYTTCTCVCMLSIYYMCCARILHYFAHDDDMLCCMAHTGWCNGQDTRQKSKLHTSTDEATPPFNVCWTMLSHCHTYHHHLHTHTHTHTHTHMYTHSATSNKVTGLTGSKWQTPNRLLYHSCSLWDGQP